MLNIFHTVARLGDSQTVTLKNLRIFNHRWSRRATKMSHRGYLLLLANLLIIRQYLKPDSPKVTSREPDAGHNGAPLITLLRCYSRPDRAQVPIISSIARAVTISRQVVINETTANNKDRLEPAPGGAGIASSPGQWTSDAFTRGCGDAASRRTPAGHRREEPG